MTPPPAAPPGPISRSARALALGLPKVRARLRRARARKVRRALAAAVILLPGLLSLGMDLGRRAARIVAFDAKHAFGFWALSLGVVALWGALVAASALPKPRHRFARQAAAGLFVTWFALAAGTQEAFFWRYNVYASFDTALFSDSFPFSLVATFPRGKFGTLATVGVTALLAIAIVALARSFFRPRGQVRRAAFPLAAALLAVGFLVPVSYRASLQSSPPDAIYFHSLARYAKERWRVSQSPEDPTHVRVQLRAPPTLPALTPEVPARRNVLFILQESLRADHVCQEYDPDCDLPARSTNPLLPERYPFLQMRSAASSTAVAVSNLWAGVDPTGSYESLHTAPILWEYAKAAGYRTAYWTSQNLIFGNARLYVQDAPIDDFAVGTTLDPKCDTLIGAKDEALSDYVIKRWGQLKEPFFAVVHYSNLHRPRRVDKKRSPYQPSADKHTRRTEGKNHYKNAVYLSDIAVAKLVKAVRATKTGKRTVIVFTADHAEALFEHKNENDHSSTVFDEEIHVPAFIDGPGKTLSDAERASLAAKKDTYLLQYDLAATVLDLLGVWDAPGIAQYRERILGRPLTRPDTFDSPRPLTNVSWVWEYHMPNWGMLDGRWKVLARADDDHYRCHDLESDPAEVNDLGEPACADLVAAAKDRFKILPREMRKHLRTRPDIWGPWPPPPLQ